MIRVAEHSCIRRTVSSRRGISIWFPTRFGSRCFRLPGRMFLNSGSWNLSSVPAFANIPILCVTGQYTSTSIFPDSAKDRLKHYTSGASWSALIPGIPGTSRSPLPVITGSYITGTVIRWMYSMSSTRIMEKKCLLKYRSQRKNCSGSIRSI
ncbi:MAG: hypothetical protein BWY20_01123 [Spirochaetes bacterium ADurb.Bin215]|nr:MAG: hypothetical protein BWY20_01123 [Spirochaetes bacterium ADurb.Bin215]